MAVVGTPYNNSGFTGNYTPESGSDRLVAACVRWYDNAITSITTLTWNSIARTPVVQRHSVSVGVALFVFKESELPGGSSGYTMQFAGGGTPVGARITWWTADDMEQGSSVTDTDTAGVELVDDTLEVTLTTVVGDLVIGGVFHLDGTPVTHNNGFTEDDDDNGPAAGHKTAASTTETYSVTWGGNSTAALVAMTLAQAGGASAPVITDVDSDESFASNATGVTITGTDFGATTGDRTVKLIQGAVEVTQTQTGGNATSGAFTVVGFATSGTLKYTSTVLEVETGDGNDTQAVTIVPPSGYAYVEIDTPDANAARRVEGDPDDIETGDQIEYDTQSATVTIYDDGSASAPAGVNSTTGRIFDADSGTWGSSGTITFVSIATIAAYQQMLRASQ